MAFINGFMNQWYMELVIMFMNGCTSQLSGISYLRLRMVILMDITWSNDLVMLELE